LDDFIKKKHPEILDELSLEKISDNVPIFKFIG